MKGFVKSKILPLLLKVGLEKLLSATSSNRTLFIMYHGVVRKNSIWFNPRHLTSKEFEEHLIYLKKNFEIISLSEAFYNYTNNLKPKVKTISITFDDGYLNNLTVALPLLEKYKIPASFFVSGYIIEEKFPIAWSDQVAWMYQQNDIFTISIDKYVFNKHPKHYFYNSDQNITIYDALKKLDGIQRDKILNEWRNMFDIESRISEMDPEIWKMMNSAELKQFSSSALVTIGSHGNKHYNLGLIQPSEAEEDILSSIKIIEATIGKKIDSIAYPDGSYTEIVKDMAEKHGLVKQLAVTYKTNSDSRDKRILPRHGISNTVNTALNMILLHKNFHNLGF